MKSKKEFIDPKIKEEINKEGFEKSDNSGEAAVLIGTKEECERMRQRLENEGNCADAATYVRMNKVISVPAEKVPEKIQNLKGSGWIGHGFFTFIDKEGNIADIKLDYSKIASITESYNDTSKEKQFIGELEKYGFNIREYTKNNFEQIHLVRNMYSSELEEKAEETRKKEFDF